MANVDQRLRNHQHDSAFVFEVSSRKKNSRKVKQANIQIHAEYHDLSLISSTRQRIYVVERKHLQVEVESTPKKETKAMLILCVKFVIEKREYRRRNGVDFTPIPIDNDR